MADADIETCPKSRKHCVHWWDGEPCCRCGDNTPYPPSAEAEDAAILAEAGIDPAAELERAYQRFPQLRPRTP